MTGFVSYMHPILQLRRGITSLVRKLQVLWQIICHTSIMMGKSSYQLSMLQVKYKLSYMSLNSKIGCVYKTTLWKFGRIYKCNNRNGHFQHICIKLVSCVVYMQLNQCVAFGCNLLSLCVLHVRIVLLVQCNYFQYSMQYCVIAFVLLCSTCIVHTIV